MPTTNQLNHQPQPLTPQAVDGKQRAQFPFATPEKKVTVTAGLWLCYLAARALTALSKKDRESESERESKSVNERARAHNERTSSHRNQSALRYDVK